MILQIVMVLILWPSLALAADLYVDNATSGCSTPTDTDYNPNTRSCGSGSELVYSTLAAAFAADASGDTIYVRDGTYVESVNNTVASGPGPGFSSVTTVTGYQGERPTIRPANYNSSFQACVWSFINDAHSIVLQHMTFDGTNCTTGGANIKAVLTSGSIRPSYIRIQDIHIINTPTSAGILAAMDNSEVLDNYIYNNGSITATNINFTGLGLYLQNGANNRIERNWFHENAGYGMQIYPLAHHTTVTRNLFTDNGRNTNVCGCYSILSSGGNDLIDFNVVRHNRGVGIGVAFGSLVKENTYIRNNSIYCASSGCTYGIQIASGTGMKIQNNIVIGTYTTKIQDGGSGTTLSTNLTVGVATDIWTDPANSNFTLKAGSPAIGAGTNIGFTFNGSAPDQGAFETFAPVSASINGVNLDITLGMNGYTPPQGTGTNLGWTVTCIGTGCGTPTVSVVTVFSGASSILRATISGISGGSCAAGQTWLVHYDASLGAVSDSILIGNSLMQPMHSFTNFSVANACAGGGAPSYPASPIVYYPLDGNAVDSSGNGNTGIITGSLTFTTARHNDGYQTTAGATQYITVPYGNAVDPTTQSLTICVGVYITPGTESTVGLVPFGAPVGTNQRLYVAATSGTWRVAAQASNSGTASDLSVVAGWNRVCLEANSVTDQVTVYNNGVAATNAGGVKAITTFALAGNFELGRLPGTGNVSGTAIYDDFHIWTNTISIADDYAAWEPPSPTPGSYTFSQPAHRFQRVYLTNGAVEDISANNAARDVVEGGAVAIIFQINCDNVADCAPTSFALRSSDNGSTYTVVPNTPTAHGVSMWGASVTHLNSGVADGPLTGSLTHTDGTTQLTAENVPNVDLAQNTSLTLRYLVRFATGLAGQTRYFKIYDQAGNALAGGYTPSTGAQVNVVPMQASVGF